MQAVKIRIVSQKHGNMILCGPDREA